MVDEKNESIEERKKRLGYEWKDDSTAETGTNIDVQQAVNTSTEKQIAMGRKVGILDGVKITSDTNISLGDVSIALVNHGGHSKQKSSDTP